MAATAAGRIQGYKDEEVLLSLEAPLLIDARLSTWQKIPQYLDKSKGQKTVV